MIFTNTTTRTVINPGAFDKPGEARETTFEMGGKQNEFAFDGKVEDSIQKALMDPEKAFANVSELTALCKDANGQVAKARHLLEEGAETVKVDVGKGERWTASNTDKPGVIELSNGGGLHSNEQTVRLSGDYVSLRTRPSLNDPNENITQKVVGRWNAAEGTITCVSEEIERSVSGDAPAPLPKAPVTPPAPPRAGEVTTNASVDTRVLGAVQKELGADRVFTGLDDEKLTRFTDWALGRNDLPFGNALNGLPEGWEEMGPHDYHAFGPGDNYQVGGPGGSYQVLNVNKETEAVTLVTSWEYRQPGDFEGSFEKVTLTRYADGEIRRDFHEMHD